MIAPAAVGRQCSNLVKNVVRPASTALTFKPKSVSVVNSPGASISELKNGVRIASENQGGDICTVGVWHDCGSRYEREHESGASSFLKHLYLQGTTKNDGTALGKELGKITYNADSYTTKEQSAVYMVCRSKDVPKAVALLGEMVLTPSFSSENVEKARNAVLGVQNSIEDDPRAIVMHYLHAQAYMKAPLEMPSTGRFTNCKEMSADTISKFHANNLQAPRLVVAATGDVDHDALVTATDKAFGGVGQSFPDTLCEQTPSRYTGSFIFHQEDSWPQAYMAAAIEGPGWDNIDDMICMKVAEKMFGGWQRSKEPYQVSPHRLPHRVGWFDHHPVHTYDTFYLPYFKTGLWGQYFVANMHSAHTTLKDIQTEWKYMATLSNARDVEVGKNFLKTEILSALENGPTTCDELARNVLRYDRHYSGQELLAMIDTVDEPMFKKATYEYIYDRCPVLIGFGRTAKVSFYGYWPARWRTAWWWM